MVGLIEHVVGALAQQARERIVDAKRADAGRDVGTLALDVGFYSKADIDKPIEDYDFHAHGRHYQGFGNRWAVWKFRWDGTEWRRIRKLTGPLKFEASLDELSALKAKTGLERKP